jgi:hypothetical protein
MPPAPRSPLDDTDRLVVDGSNLLHRLSGPAAPPSTIVGRLRAAVPATVAIELFFDGVGHGITGRLAQNMHVRYSGRRTGDEAILELVGDGTSSPLAASRTLVVTDDRELRTALAIRGARTAGTAWLLGRMDVSAVAPAQGRRRSSIGAGRPPAGAAASYAGGGAGGPGGRDDADGRPGWRPGRGATSKTGTPHKIARHRRHPRHP